MSPRSGLKTIPQAVNKIDGNALTCQGQDPTALALQIEG